jgi:hypothetical protein
MRVLLSGFTQRATNSQKLRYDYLTAVYIMRDALGLLGHQVDHRAVTPGEDLSGYDRAILVIGPTKSFTCRFIPGAAWVYNNMPGRVTLLADDWSIEKTGYDFRNTLSRWEKWLQFFQTCGPVKGQELADHGVRQTNIYEMLEDITASKDQKLLAPMFTWGKHELLMKDNLPSTLVSWDPTPLIEPLLGRSSEPREKRWVMATLQKNTKVPRGQWPVHQVGNKRDGQAYLPEAEIFKLYQESAGVICPPYQKAGSGWWRYRYQLAADAGAVLWLDARDKACMGAAYMNSLPDYEKMSDEERVDVAWHQGEWFYTNSATREQTLSVIQEALA